MKREEQAAARVMAGQEYVSLDQFAARTLHLTLDAHQKMASHILLTVLSSQMVEIFWPMESSIKGIQCAAWAILVVAYLVLSITWYIDYKAYQGMLRAVGWNGNRVREGLDVAGINARLAATRADIMATAWWQKRLARATTAFLVLAMVSGLWSLLYPRR